MERVQRIHALNLVLKDEFKKYTHKNTAPYFPYHCKRVYRFIIWLQQYPRSNWLLSGHYFLVMTGIMNFFF